MKGFKIFKSMVYLSLLVFLLAVSACGQAAEEPAQEVPAAEEPTAEEMDAEEEETAEEPAEEEPAEEEEETAEEPAEEEPAEPIEFDLWHVQTSNPEIIDDAAARYMEDNPHVTVNTDAIVNDVYKDQIQIALGAGEEPCVFISWGGGPMAQYVFADAIIDLTDYMEEDDYKDRFLDASFASTSIDGRIYGVPVENVTAAAIYYHKGIFEEHGLTPPETWDDLMETVDTLNEAGIAPFALANANPWPGSMFYMYIVDRLAGPDLFFSAANRTGGSFEDPVFIQAGEMLQDLVEAGAFNEGFNGLNWDDGVTRQLMYADEAAMELMGNWQISMAQGENEAFFNENLGVFPFPAIEGGEGDPSNVVGSVGQNYYHIASSCEHPDEAFEMITYLIDDESIEERVDIGRIPPVKGFEPKVPLAQEVFSIVQDAQSVQLWYDQFLPEELANVHLQTSQALYDLSMTPEEAAAAMEQAAVEYFEE